MKSNAKSKVIVLIALGILFALSPIISTNLSLIAGSSNKSPEYRDDANLDKENLKTSAISRRIHIVNNSGWVDFKNAGNCTGEGTYSDPYVIEDCVIDTNNTGNCIWIEISTVYFRIENCTLYNSRDYAGIKLNNIKNSQLIGNNCSSNYYGIHINNGENNTISGNTANNNNYGIYLQYNDYSTILGNTANNNGWCGIYLTNSDHVTVSGNTANYNMYGIIFDSGNSNISGNTANNNGEHGIFLNCCELNAVSGNTANNNGVSGIYLQYIDYSTILGNTANNNKYGIYLWYSDINTVSGNIFLGNDECIKEVGCIGNTFENNDCGIIFLILIISGVAIVVIVTVSLIKHLRKRIQ